MANFEDLAAHVEAGVEAGMRGVSPVDASVYRGDLPRILRLGIQHALEQLLEEQGEQ